MRQRHHPHLAHELYTPKDARFMEVMEIVRASCGGSWREVGIKARLNARSFRRLKSERYHRRKSEYKVASYRMMDKVLTRTGHPDLLQTLEWYTPDQLVEMGIWKPHSGVGLVWWDLYEHKPDGTMVRKEEKGKKKRRR
jgi:hypothetical protein